MGLKGLMKKFRNTPEGTVEFKSNIIMCDGNTDVHMEMETKYMPMNVLMVLEATVRWSVEALVGKGVSSEMAIVAARAAFMAGASPNPNVVRQKGAEGVE